MINKREIMKKTYITPECEVLNLTVAHDMLFPSSTPVAKDDDGEVVGDMQSKKFGEFDRYFGGARSPWMKD